MLLLFSDYLCVCISRQDRLQYRFAKTFERPFERFISRGQTPHEYRAIVAVDDAVRQPLAGGIGAKLSARYAALEDARDVPPVEIVFFGAARLAREGCGDALDPILRDLQRVLCDDAGGLGEGIREPLICATG